MDGSERLGGLACVVFLDLNGLRSDLGHDEACGLVTAVADGTIHDVRVIADSLRRVTR